jgi:hypothetical protein
MEITEEVVSLAVKEYLDSGGKITKMPFVIRDPKVVGAMEDVAAYRYPSFDLAKERSFVKNVAKGILNPK